MAIAGVVTQSADGETLTFTDTSTGISVTSRILTIYDSNGDLLETIDMGGNLTATYGITADVYLSFILTLNTSQTVTVNYISTQFYALAQARLAALLAYPCKCDGATCSAMVKARECINSATTYFNIGDGESSQLMLTAADYYILNPTY